MTLEEQFNVALDITPTFGVITVEREGRKINIPLLEGEVGALFVSEDQGVYVDKDGGEWLIGTRKEGLVKRRFA